MIYIGIDPGQKGGIAMLSQAVNRAIPMPLYGKEIDAAAIMAFVTSIDGDKMAIIEKASAMPKQGVVSMFTFGKGYGKVLAVMECIKIRHQIVTPQAWKKVVLAGTAKDKTAAIEYSTRMYPEIELMPGRCRTPQDGIADAVCIARYGMMMCGGRIK